MSRGLWRAVIAALLAWSVAGRAWAFPPLDGVDVRGLTKVWELNLDRSVPSCDWLKGFRTPVQAIRFSPRGDSVAASVGECPSGDFANQSLIVVPLDRPEPRVLGQVVQVSDIIGTIDYAGFDWSPDGRTISAGQGRLIRVSDGGACETGVNRGGVFLGSGRWVGVNSLGQFPKQRTDFSIYDMGCHALSHWMIESGCIALCSAPERDLVLLDCQGARTRLVRGFDGTRIRGPEYEGSSDAVDDRPTGLLGNGGRAICGSVSEGGREGRVLPVCWDVDTGRVIGEAPFIDGGLPLMPARDASRVVVTHYRRVLHFTIEDPYDDVPVREGVWDFATGREAASWPVRVQSFPVPLKNGRRIFKAAYAFAISADGNYVAVGGSGVLTLYRINAPAGAPADGKAAPDAKGKR